MVCPPVRGDNLLAKAQRILQTIHGITITCTKYELPLSGELYIRLNERLAFVYLQLCFTCPI